MKISYLLLPLCLLAACDKTQAPASAGPAAPVVQPPPAQMAIAMTAQALQSAYKTNEVAADEKFKGRDIQVSGVIAEIGKAPMGEPCVKLKTGNEFENVYGLFEEADKAPLMSLKPGMQVKILGKGDGMQLGDVHLIGCKIVQ